VGRLKSRLRLALNCLEIFQPGIGAQEDQRYGSPPLVGQLRPLLEGTDGAGFGGRFGHPAGQHVVQ
jgi:hypothetical protein